MSVVIETTLGDITVDLYLDQRPVTCLNFLKLCKMKYYNYNLFHTIRNGFIAQTGDPSGEGAGGQSIWGILEGPHKRFFSGEKMPKIRHTDAGLLSMVCTDDMMIGSQFFFTLAPDLNSLDGTHCVIGEVTEGHDVLTKLNEVICDESYRPYRDVRITHTVILEDPFNDPVGLRAPSRSPSPSAERLKGGRIAPDEEIDEAQGKTAEEIQEMIEEKEAKARATILEIVGDLPDAEIAPPENVLFVCKLNPVTTDDDLEIIFSRFGKIVSCEVIRDKKTGNSLQYAFIEFDNKKSCEDAYFKMDNVLIDDRRIHVDFSQSVSKMRWLGKGRGVQYFDDDSNKPQRNANRSSQRGQKPDNTNNRRHYDNERNGKDNHRHEKERERYRDHKEQTKDKEYRSRVREITSSSSSNRKRSRSCSRLNNSHDRTHERRQEKSRYYKDTVKSREHKDKNRESYEYDNKGNHRNYNSQSSPSKKVRTESPSRRHRDKDISDSKNSHKSNRNKHENNGSKYDEYNCQKSNKASRSEKIKKNISKSIESKTPSPVTKDEKKQSKKDYKEKTDKLKPKKKTKKRKHSTSSSESSESSSSSDSSSSESDRKKKKLRRKRKNSSSSSSDSSSSSSSSSETSSDSTSSSDSSCKKKRQKKKIIKKNKKKP